MSVGILLLAAGSSTRFGSDKRLALLANNKSVIDNTLEQISKTQLPVTVCLKPNDIALQQQLSHRKISWILNQNASVGMGSSIAAGIRLCKQWDATIIALADMPYLSSHTYASIAKVASSGKIIIPIHHKKKGNPVCFGSNFYSQLQELNGDKGGKDIVLKNPQAIIELELEDEGILKDIDKPADL
jgi:molybdenum cofactor cytidylyltransferase